MTFYLKLDAITREPRRLLRADNGTVSVWYQDEWRETQLLQAELDGLGGSSDYFTIEERDIGEWLTKLNG
jgi:hypothetical protein